jgi:hypothetical protein
MRHVLLHGHIFKNAGTTFDWSLARSFGAGFMDHRDDKAMREQRARHLAALLSEHPELKAVSSHFLCYPLPELEGVELHAMFLLRHPIERIASVYAFERKQQAETRGARAAKEKSFAEYVAWRLEPRVPRTIRDYQTSNIAGTHDVLPAQGPAASWLAVASARVDRATGVGVVDRYDDSMIVLEAALRPAFPQLDLAYVRQNVTQTDTRSSIEEKVDGILERLGDLAGKVLRQNAFDLALYRQANLRLDQALAEIADLDARREDFHRRCKALQSRRRWRRA